MGSHELSVAERVRILEELASSEALAERKRNAAAFSDEQRRQMEESIGKALVALVASDAFTAAVDLRLEYNAGKQAVRFLLYLAGAFAAGLATAWFKLKGG